MFASSAQYVVDGCSIWNDRDATPYYSNLHQHLSDLDRYNDLIATSFPREMDDVRIGNQVQSAELTSRLDVGTIFEGSGQLSTCGRQGFTEPILAPMRHPKWCRMPPASDGDAEPCLPRHPNCHILNYDYLLDSSYLVHDWSAMGRSISPKSRTVFIDMGASLSFHRDKKEFPILDLINQYSKFGIKFDHVYAYELTPANPDDVFQLVPDFLMASYHWINQGVDTDRNSKLNPLTMVKMNYDRDDFVVVKLDIDTVEMESAFIDQLLSDDELAEKIDHLYWEHHVGLKGHKEYKRKYDESPKLSIELMTMLRQKGICAHYWI